MAAALSHLIGLTLLDTLIGVDQLTSLSDEDLIALIAPRSAGTSHLASNQPAGRTRPTLTADRPQGWAGTLLAWSPVVIAVVGDPCTCPAAGGVPEHLGSLRSDSGLPAFTLSRYAATAASLSAVDSGIM